MSTVLAGRYRIKPGNRSAVSAWFASASGQDILRRMHSETQVNYVSTYLVLHKDPAMQTPDDFDAYDMWEAPDLSAFRSLQSSPAYAEFEEQFHPLIVDRSWNQIFLERANA